MYLTFYARYIPASGLWLAQFLCYVNRCFVVFITVAELSVIILFIDGVDIPQLLCRTWSSQPFLGVSLTSGHISIKFEHNDFKNEIGNAPIQLCSWVLLSWTLKILFVQMEPLFLYRRTSASLGVSLTSHLDIEYTFESKNVCKQYKIRLMCLSFKFFITRLENVVIKDGAVPCHVCTTLAQSGWLADIMVWQFAIGSHTSADESRHFFIRVRQIFCF